MTDASVIVIAGSVAGIVGGVPVIIKAWADARAAKEDREERRRVAGRVEEVAAAARKVVATLANSTSATAEALAGLARVADATHVLVNKRYGEVLQVAATVARALARQTGAKDDLMLADTAERLVTEHQAQQRLLDRGQP